VNVPKAQTTVATKLTRCESVALHLGYLVVESNVAKTGNYINFGMTIAGMDYFAGIFGIPAFGIAYVGPNGNRIRPMTKISRG
jgi:hypothetical protein